MIVERFGIAPSHREYRACGRFDGTEIRQLIGGGVDPRTLGCPEHVFLSVLESRAARKTTRSAPTTAPMVTDDDRRRKAREVEVLIQQDAAAEWARGQYS